MPPEEVVHPAGCLLWVAGHGLDVNFEVPFQELVYLPIVVVIVSDGKDPGSVTQALISQAEWPTHPTLQKEEQRVARKARR